MALTITLTVVVTACSSSTSDEPIDAFQMKFAAKEATGSRATLTTGSTLTDKSVLVYGDKVATDGAETDAEVVFNGTEVSYNAGAWSYSDLQYWYSENTYSFVAHHPAELKNIEGTPKYENNNLSFQYTYPESYKDAQDILVATHRRKYTPGNPHKVTFNFGHIFARLNFVAKLDPRMAASRMVIRRLALVNVSTKATYSIKPAAISGGTQTDDFTGAWSDFSEPTGTLFETNNNVTVNSGDQVEIFPIDNPLLVIPQNLSQDIKVEITYSQSGTDANPRTAEANIFAPSLIHNGVWLAGQTYTYTFTLDNSGYITFNNPTVQDWNEAEGANYVVTD